MGEFKTNTLFISEEIEIPVSHEVQIELDVFGRCSRCKKKIKINDVVVTDNNVFIEVEPHNCK